MPKRQVSVPKREVCVPKRQVYVPKRQQLGLRGAETATFKKVPKWGVTPKRVINKFFYLLTITFYFREITCYIMYESNFVQINVCIHSL